MTRSHTRQNRVGLGLLAALVALLGYQTFASRPAAGPTQPAVIATFDLERTFNTIDAKKAAYEDVARLAKDLQAKTEQMAKDITQMQGDLADLLPGSDKHRELQNKLVESSERYRAQMEFIKIKVESERAKAMRRVYLTIREAAAALAKQEGYAVVFVDDSIAELPMGSEEETNRQISARRMVYTSPEVDITDVLIEHMNASFRTAGPAPAPSPRAPRTNP